MRVVLNFNVVCFVPFYSEVTFHEDSIEYSV